MTEILTFEDAIEQSAQYRKRNLLLGNGFSIACNPTIFTYGSLYEQAKETHFEDIPEAAKLFEVFDTKDFEVVIRALENASKTLPVFTTKGTTITDKMQQQAEELKTALVRTIADNHPDIPNQVAEERFWACRRFLAYFLNGENDGRVYTLNYDLLLYWAALHDDPEEEELALSVNDGFGRDEDEYDTDYVTWQGENNARDQRLHYLHGAIHLFDAGSELKKYTWVNTGVPLLDQARAAMGQGMFPLFVAEGTSQQKLAKIKHSAYLYHSYKSFSEVMKQKDQALFIYGHSLAENDKHILDKIPKGKVPHIFVSLYGNPDENHNKAIIQTAHRLKSHRHERFPLKVSFYDAASVNVWGDN